MGAFSISHWLIVMVVVLLVFGPKRLSEVGKGLGQGVRNFKAGLGELDAEDSAPAKPKARLSDAVSEAASVDAARGSSSQTATSSESEPPRV